MCRNRDAIKKAIRELRTLGAASYAVFSHLNGGELVGLVVVWGAKATAYGISNGGGVSDSRDFTWCGYLSKRIACRQLGYPTELFQTVKVVTL